MERKYSLINKSDSIANIQLYGTYVKKTILPGGKITIFNPTSGEIKYYNQMRKIGIILVKEEAQESQKFEGSEKVSEGKQVKEVSKIGEESEDFVKQDTEQFSEDNAQPEKQVDEKEVEEQKDEVLDNLEELSLDELRKIAKEKGVDYYWRKGEETLIEEIRRK